MCVSTQSSSRKRTALSQYIQQEAVGTRMRRWNRPIHDFLAPYLRGTIERLTGESLIPKDVEHRRDLDTMADMLQFLRAEREACSHDLVPLLPRNINLRARGREGPIPADGELYPGRVGCRKGQLAEDRLASQGCRTGAFQFAILPWLGI
jgi:hypothetical protein